MLLTFANQNVSKAVTSCQKEIKRICLNFHLICWTCISLALVITGFQFEMYHINSNFFFSAHKT